MVSGQRPSVAAGGVTLSSLLSNTSDSSVPVDTRTIRRTASPNGAPAAGCPLYQHQVRLPRQGIRRAPYALYCLGSVAEPSLNISNSYWSESWAIFRSLPPPVCFHCLSGICGSIHTPLCQLLLSCTHCNEQVCRYILCLIENTRVVLIQSFAVHISDMYERVCAALFWDTCFLHIFIFLSACSRAAAAVYFNYHLISK